MLNICINIFIEICQILLLLLLNILWNWIHNTFFQIIRFFLFALHPVLHNIFLKMISHKMRRNFTRNFIMQHSCNILQDQTVQNFTQRSNLIYFQFKNFQTFMQSSSLLTFASLLFFLFHCIVHADSLQDEWVNKYSRDELFAQFSTSLIVALTKEFSTKWCNSVKTEFRVSVRLIKETRGIRGRDRFDPLEGWNAIRCSWYLRPFLPVKSELTRFPGATAPESSIITSRQRFGAKHRRLCKIWRSEIATRHRNFGQNASEEYTVSFSPGRKLTNLLKQNHEALIESYLNLRPFLVLIFFCKILLLLLLYI